MSKHRMYPNGDGTAYSESCPFHLELTCDELTGLKYLLKTLRKICEKKEHKNLDKAMAAARALMKMEQYHKDIHKLAHEMYATVETLEECIGELQTEALEVEVFRQGAESRIEQGGELN